MTYRALFTITASALIAAGGPALAQSQSPTSNSSGDGASARSTESAANRRICVNQETTGSRLQKRVCRTRQQWEREGGLPTEETR